MYLSIWKLNRRVLKIVSVLCCSPLVKQAYLQKFISVIDDLFYKTIKHLSFSTEHLDMYLCSSAVCSHVVKCLLDCVYKQWHSSEETTSSSCKACEVYSLQIQNLKHIDFKMLLQLLIKKKNLISPGLISR